MQNDLLNLNFTTIDGNDQNSDITSLIIILLFIHFLAVLSSLISFLVFLNKTLSSLMHIYLFLNALFNLISSSLNFIYSILILITKWKILGTEFNHNHEFGVKNFFINSFFTIAILCQIICLFERYSTISINNHFTSLNAFISIVFMFVFSFLSNFPILFQYKYDVINLTDINISKNYPNINLINEEMYSMMTLIIQMFLDFLFVIVPVIMIFILLFKLKSLMEIKRESFAKLSIEQNRNSFRLCLLENNYRKSYTSILEQSSADLFEDTVLKYEKTMSDLTREKLIAMIVIVNIIISIARLGHLFYLFDINLFNANYLSKNKSLKLSILFSLVNYLTQTINLFLYLVFDKKFRRSYEKIFKPICYFKIHLPKKKKKLNYKCCL